jgi:hypothetical protein
MIFFPTECSDYRPAKKPFDKKGPWLYAKGRARENALAAPERS